MISAYCWCGNLELGWLGSLGYILFQLTESPKQMLKISQECMIDAGTQKCTFPVPCPPEDWSPSVCGREGSWGVGEQYDIERLRYFSFFLFGLLVAEQSVFLLTLFCWLMYPHPVLLLLCQDSAWLTASSPSFLSPVLFPLFHISVVPITVLIDTDSRREQTQKLPMLGRAPMSATSPACKKAHLQKQWLFFVSAFTQIERDLVK